MTWGEHEDEAVAKAQCADVMIRPHIILSLIAIVLAAVLSGCSGQGSVPPLPALHVAGVTTLSGLSTVRGSDPADDIAGLVAYTLPGADTRVLVRTRFGFYNLGLNNGSPRRETVTPSCDPIDLAVLRDGRWALCHTTGGDEVFAPEAPPPIPGRIMLADRPSGGEPAAYPDADSPTWAADGMHVAVMIRPPDAPNVRSVCSIAIVSVDASAMIFKPTAFLTLPFDPATTCIPATLMWSPDGSQLLILERNDLYTLRLSALSTSPFGHEAAPITIPVPQTLLVSLGQGLHVAWDPSAPPTITVIRGPGAIVQVDRVTRHEVTLLSLSQEDTQAGELCGQTWTPDGSHLVFAYCGPSSIDVYGAEVGLYVFTPSAGVPG